MKFTDEVVAALAILRANAENDFERHRIDVLERDLTAPPVAEVIDDKHQKFDGINFCKGKDGHYRINVSIQQAIWRYCHGEIPLGHDIHHINTDKDDNSINNLQLLTRSEHTRKHRETFNMPPRKMETFTCIVCGNTFQSQRGGKNLYCSVHCRNLRNKNAEHYKEWRTCLACGGKFKISKFDRTICCSHSCAQKIGWERRKKNNPPMKKTCAFCGKEFETYSQRAKYCSKLCCTKASKAKRKN